MPGKRWSLQVAEGRFNVTVRPSMRQNLRDIPTLTIPHCLARRIHCLMFAAIISRPWLFWLYLYSTQQLKSDVPSSSMHSEIAVGSLTGRASWL
jgi:hypothetical protein